jgi:hypothetical protein
MIDLTVHEEQLERTINLAREKGLIIPTFRQHKDPTLVPEIITDRLKKIRLWDIHSCNLFRITWKNEPLEFGGGFGDVNAMEVPS